MRAASPRLPYARPATGREPGAGVGPGRWHRWSRALRDAWSALRQPALPGEREAVAAARARLPVSVRDEPGQFIGRHTVGCSATWGVQERCQFACTACYLAPDANAIPPLPFEQVREQLAAIRAVLGPWGNVQITAGEVTLLPEQKLLAILRACQELQLTPMLMTNGEVLRDRPEMLASLVSEGGLFRIATHIDTTQIGRRGQAAGLRERDIHPLREEFARLIRSTRATTGIALQAAQTVTVTQETLDDVPDVVRWMLLHVDSYRMLSLQPVAQVGRTRARGPGCAPVGDPGSTASEPTDAARGESRPGVRDALWERIEAGVGRRLEPRAVPFGDADCNSIAPLLVVTIAGRPHVVEAVRDGSRLDRWFVARLMNSGLAGYNPIGEPASTAFARLAGRFLHDPRLLLQIPVYAACRVWSERATLARIAGAVLMRRPWSLRPLTIVVHRFMDAAELDTPRGRERLLACTFRVPVDGEMVSMCAFNAAGRRGVPR